MTTDQLDGRTLKKAQIEPAYDVLVQSIGAEAALSALQTTLTEAGYPHAQHLPQIIGAYQTRRSKTDQAPATVDALDATGRALVEAIAGALPATETAARQEAPADAAPADAGPAGTSDSLQGDTPERAGRNDAPASADTDDHADTSESEDAVSTQTADTQTANTQSAETQAATGAQTSSVDGAAAADAFTPSGLGATQIDTTRINKMLSTASQRRISDVQKVFDAITAAEDTVAEQAQQIARAEQALALIEQGDMESAQAIEIGQPITAKASGLAEIELSDDHAEFVDAALDKASGGEIETYAQLIDSLRAAESRAGENAERLRELRRDIKAKGPKPKASAKVTNAAGQIQTELDCEVVYRKASEIFTDAFGHSAPILDFDIPTLEWPGEPHPEVPEINSSFRFYAPVLAKALFGLKTGKISWLMGETGCGKSEFWAQVAARIGFPYIRMNMDAHLTRGDLIGTSRLVPGESGQPVMTFVEGIIPRALQMPCIMLIDEFDLGDPEIMPVIQPVLEGKGVRLLEDGGRYVKPHELCVIGATGNTNGLGSDNNVYLNAHEQSGATRDRIAMYIEMPYLPADKELEVVMARVPHADQAFAEKVIQLANKTRESYKLGDIGQLVSTRHVLDAIELHAHNAPLYGDEDEVVADTLECVVLNFCDANTRSVVRGYIDAIF